MRLVPMAWWSLLIVLLLGPSPGQAEGRTWSGSWAVRWPDGSASLQLRQAGTRVDGRYPLYGGTLTGQAHGRTLTGTVTEGGATTGIVLRLSPRGDSFAGRAADGTWWTGGRIAAHEADQASRTVRLDQGTPRAVLRSFLLVGNRARAGVHDEGGYLPDIVEFGTTRAGLTRRQRVDAAQALFALVDLTTASLQDVPNVTAENAVEITLRQAGTGATLPLRLQRDGAGKWWIVLPDAASLESHRGPLLARHGGHMPAQDAYKQRLSARDTVRSFLDAFHDWPAAGTQAFAAMDLSQIPEAIRAHEAEKAALLLKRLLDRISLVIPQEIPDDPAARDPYVHFIHPEGRIEVGLVGEGPAARWQFTAASVAALPALYAAMGSLPAVEGRLAPTPSTLFFALRHLVVVEAPWLLHRVWQVEYWEALAAVLTLVLAFALAFLLVRGTLLVHRRVLDGQAALGVRLRWPLCLAVAVVFWQWALAQLDLPMALYGVVAAGNTIVVVVALAWTAWQVLDHVTQRWMSRPADRFGSADEIGALLGLGALRLAVIAGALVLIAGALSLPYEGLIAGLGVGGLALAFASRETLSNVFGAGILAADRPFRRGDVISTSEVKGAIEHVGIRSTRVRMADGTLLFVPNGKLSDATINNLGPQRERSVDATLVLPYSLTPEQFDAFIAELRTLVDRNSNVIPGRTLAGVTSLSGSGVEVRLTCALVAESAVEERAARHALMLDIIRLGDRMGIPVGQGHEPRGTAPDMPSQPLQLAMS